MTINVAPPEVKERAKLLAERYERYRAAQRHWAEKNRDRVKASQRRWVEENRDKVRRRAREYERRKREENPEASRRYHREYRARRLAVDVQYKLAIRLRKRLWRALRKSLKTGSAVRNLGCSIEELKRHLESQFEPGMTWENWTYNGWHIDHIRPLTAFDLTDPEQLKKACHYSNLQPMWASDNIRKGNRYAGEI